MHQAQNTEEEEGFRHFIFLSVSSVPEENPEQPQGKTAS